MEHHDIASIKGSLFWDKVINKHREKLMSKPDRITRHVWQIKLIGILYPIIQDGVSEEHLRVTLQSIINSLCLITLIQCIFLRIDRE